MSCSLIHMHTIIVSGNLLPYGSPKAGHLATQFCDFENSLKNILPQPEMFETLKYTAQ